MAKNQSAQAKNPKEQRKIPYEEIPQTVKDLVHRIYSRPHCAEVIAILSGIKKRA